MTEETIVHDGVKKNSNPFLIPGSIIVAGLCISFAVWASKPTSVAQEKGNTDLDATSVELRENDHVFGSKDADVFFVEYSDYRCGYCGVFHETIQSILKEHEGKVAWVYRHTPYQPGGKEAAIAGECIAELVGEDAFWEYTNKVFANQKSLSPVWSKNIALELGADEAKYDECFSSGKFEDIFSQTSFEAQELGGNGTPYTVLLTKDGDVIKFSGAQPLENVKIFVKRALDSIK